MRMNKELRVLLVEDNEDDERLLSFELKKSYQLTLKRVETKEDYLTQIKEFNPKIIISDYNLPSFNGIEALNIRQMEVPLTPFILVTGSINETTAVECMKAGADDYIIKEHLNRLIPSIESAIEKKENQKTKISALDALKKSEETFLNIFNNSVIAIYVINKEGKFLEVNQAALDFYLCERKDLIGKNFSVVEADGKNDLNKITELMKLCMNGTPQQFEFWAKKKNGAVFPKTVKVEKGTYFGETVIFAYAVDITERKKAEETLKESEAFQKALIESSPLPFISIDLQGNVVTWNEAAEKVFGWTEEEVIGKPNPIIPPDKSEEFKSLSKFVLEGNSFSGKELKRIRKDGALISISLSTAPIYNSENKIIGVMASAEDITEKKKNDEQLRLLSTSVEQSPVGKVITDPQGVIQYVNKSFCKISGYAREEVVGKNPRMLQSGYHTKEFYENLWNTILSGKTWEGEFRNKRKNGELYWESAIISPIINEEGDITHFIEVKEDITEKRRIEKLIRSQNELLNVMFENIPVILWRSDPEINTVWYNKEFSKKIGWETKATSNINYMLEKCYPDPDYRKSVVSFMEKADSSWKEFVLTNCEGRRVPCLWSNIKLKDGSLIGIGIDLTDRKEYERDLIEAKEKAESADKLKTEFLAQMSHEIRTPINAVIGNHNLLRELVGKEFLDEYIDIFTGIESASRRIIRTIDLILNMAEIQSGSYLPDFSEINLEKGVFDRLIKEFKIPAELKKLDLVFESEIDNPVIVGDEYSIIQIFSNVIDNAVKYTNKGKVKIKICSDLNRIIVEISDTGIGISKEFMENLFDAFAQEEAGYSRSYDGNGLGLALVKKYCEINSAHIEAESEKNVGSTFRVIFNK
jgi:PAS domain S-box-containing protein